MTDITEKVARAIYEANPYFEAGVAGYIQWDAMDADNQHEFRLGADAALSASGYRERETELEAAKADALRLHREKMDLWEANREMREALEPFSTFADNVDENGWTSTIHREPISTWFGPSDFRRARSALKDGA